MLRLSFRITWLWGFLLCGLAQGAGVEPVLPEGSAPAPLVSRYFPDRVHEFVWRNWNVVEPAKLAAILGTSVENVQALAESMGLPPAGDDSAGDEDARLHHADPAQLASVAVRAIAGRSWR